MPHLRGFRRTSRLEVPVIAVLSVYNEWPILAKRRKPSGSSYGKTCDQPLRFQFGSLAKPYAVPCRTSTSITVFKSFVTSTSENFGNISQEPVSLWIEQLAAADHDAASRLWAYFCQRLMVFARSRMSPSTRRIYDEEDAAASAFRSLCRGIEAQRFPEVGDRGNLWALLVVITSRKIANQFRYEHQQRRNANQTLNESMLQPSDDSCFNVLQSLPSHEPTPAFAAEVADMSEYLMSHLPESDLKQLVLLKLEGHTNEDVAELMKITRRTVQRKLERIRRIWLESAELPKPNQT